MAIEEWVSINGRGGRIMVEQVPTKSFTQRQFLVVIRGQTYELNFQDAPQEIEHINNGLTWINRFNAVPDGIGHDKYANAVVRLRVLSITLEKDA